MYASIRCRAGGWLAYMQYAYLSLFPWTSLSRISAPEQGWQKTDHIIWFIWSCMRIHDWEKSLEREWPLVMNIHASSCVIHDSHWHSDHSNYATEVPMRAFHRHHQAQNHDWAWSSIYPHQQDWGLSLHFKESDPTRPFTKQYHDMLINTRVNTAVNTGVIFASVTYVMYTQYTGCGMSGWHHVHELCVRITLHVLTHTYMHTFLICWTDM